VSVHYLVDPFTPAKTIIDVTTPENGQTDSTGALLIRVPDGAAIHGAPADLVSLLDAKAAGLLASYAGFTSIVSDACLTPDGLAAAANISIGSGLVNHSLFNNGGLLTADVPLSSAPPACVVVWEAYSFINNDPDEGRFSRVYVEEDSDLFTCSVSFDGLATELSTTNGAVLNVPVDSQGSVVTLTFINTSGSRLYLGSWAVIY